MHRAALSPFRAILNSRETLPQRLLRRAEAGIFNEDQAQDALSRANIEHDGVAIGVAFLKFLLEE